MDAPVAAAGVHAPRPAASTPLFNIAEYLPAMAASAPGRDAVICSHKADRRGRTRLTFSEMNRESDELANGLKKLGLTPGMRTLLMVRPGLDFVTLTFALFKAGAVPVLIDPGMGGKNLLNCIQRSRPEAFIAIPLAHAIRTLRGGDAFKSVQLNVTAGSRWFWGGATLERVFDLGRDAGPEMAATTRESDAAILFTTGSTGIPKGVLYKHGMFDAQVRAIREEYGIQPGEVDLPAFPLFALFSTALGTTCVIPDMDPTRPAQCDPQKIVRAIQEHGVTYSFGSPAIWKRLAPYLKQHGVTLPKLKRILMAGAPVKGDVLAPFIEALPNGDTFIPYGATEALPVSSMRGSEVVRETWALTRQGRGHCVGRPLPGVTVKIIREPASNGVWDESLVLPPKQIGEIVVTSPMVTREYFEMPAETAKAKLIDAGTSGRGDAEIPRVWHRMGDMGYLDDTGRLWFCGRKAHRVVLSKEKTLYSVCVEAVFEAFLEQHLTDRTFFPNGVRVALAGVATPAERFARATSPSMHPTETQRDQRAYIVVEIFGARWWRGFNPDVALVETIEKFRSTHELAQDISGVLWYQGRFPVDIRHNAKINREALSAWAGERVGTADKRR